MNDRRSFGRLLAGTTATAAIAAGLCAPAGAVAVPTDQARHAATTVASGPAPAARRDTWEPRPEQYAGTVTTTDIPIEMDDGVTLRADLTLPADADGEAVDRPLPVLVTITAYNKTVLANGGGSVLNGGEPDYLVKRGYAELVVDARGTGSSEGVWQTFSARENEDAGAVVEWAHRQPWSNGKVGMTGPSYMGISQIFAAGQRPAGLKAIFPQVPAADVYRDVVASGGQIDVGFIPLWMGLVTGTGLVPPAFGLSEPQNGLQWVLDRLLTATTFTGPVMLEAILGGEPAYDGPFYRERSPIEVIDRVDVPT
ncbi:MAG TPA: CocE/NonD family hydrolase, partial [Nocardioides sp.]|nr:CocE/NonD family hydrolase [Nocardioides sp.]